MAVKRKKTGDTDMLMPKLYISNLGYRPLGSTPHKTPYKTTRAILANFITTTAIIALLVLFSFLLTPEKPEKNMADIELAEELSDEHYPLPGTLIGIKYIEKLIKERITAYHLDESEVEAGFEEPYYAPEPEIFYPAPPPLFSEGEAAITVRTAPMIAIVIDDMGFEGYKTEGIIELPAPLTLSFLPYVKSLENKLSLALEKGHEIMIHVPMEPTDAKYDAGPGYLKVSMPTAEIKEKSRKIFKDFKYFTGVNNHMGSCFTEQEGPMRAFMEELKHHGGFFLDSKTTPKSIAAAVADEYGVSYLSRDVFLDNVPKKREIIIQLQKLEVLAAKKGYAIGIGHPYKATIEALKEWLPLAKENGFKIVPLTGLLNQKIPR